MLHWTQGDSMRNDDKTGVSERLFQEGVNYFIKNPDRWISRRELQDKLGIGKTQTCKLIDVLSMRIHLIQEEQKHENSPLRLKLESEYLRNAEQELASISTLTDDDRRILSVLMNMADSSGLYGNMVKNLRNHIAMSRFSQKGIFPIISYNPEMQTRGEGSQFIPLLFQAIEQGKSVWITYKTNWGDDVKRYTINPIGFFKEYESLYLFSYNAYHKQNMVHAISRIKNIELNKEASTPEKFKDLSAVIDPFGIAIDSKTITVKVWIDHYQAPFEKEAARSETAKIIDNKDGSIIMTVKTRNRFACKRWLMSLGRQAKCLEPKELADEIRDEHAEAAEQY